MKSNLIEDVLAYNPKKGQLAFWWLGQLGYVVKTKSVTLCFDPFLKPDDRRTVPPLLAPEELRGMDYVFGSHNHSDHIDHFAWPKIAKADEKTKFVVPCKILPKLAVTLDIPLERFIGLDEAIGFKNNEQGITIDAIASAHEFLAPDPITGFHDNLGFIVNCDGLRIYHSGDTCKYEGLETKLKILSPFDVMFIPINGRDAERYTDNCIGNMNFAEAVDLTGAVKPALVVPGHYEMFEANSENPSKFTDYLEAKYKGQCYWVGSHGERIEYPGGLQP